MIDYTRFTLDNGLRVVHNYDPTTAMVAVDTLYDVGSRDENPDLTGLAHLFEHLMFGGSVNIPDFDAEIGRVGGINNASTGGDFTNFYDVAPAVNFETLLWLESDRMLGLAFSLQSLEVQRSVVIEEFKQTHLNRPYGDLYHKLRQMLYTTHPYRWPTIGIDPSHIERVTMDDVKHFFYTHYAPNNAILAVSGNITLDECRRQVEKWYGDIPRRDIARRTWLPEPEITAPRSTIVTGDVPRAMVVVAYPMPPYGARGYIEGDLLTDILASGRSSRFYVRILGSNPIFAEADASISGDEEGGFLMLRAQMAEGMESHTAEAADILVREASALCHIASAEWPDGVTVNEVTRAVNRYVSNSEFASMSYLGRAESLALAELHGEDVNERVARYRAITPADIAWAAETILNPDHACTLTYLPNRKSEV
ncbi:MAG: insulinase family protein [Muribaculaceae bacterium]|nr:insulinase family protein [Muribaculaceae bacterium]